jgi:MOSC domain-containing protein YiiM
VGIIERIYIAAESGRPVMPLTTATLVTGCGIQGDRNYRVTGADPSEEVTLIEIEAVDRFNAATGLGIDSGDPRRNIVTRGVALNALVGKPFRIGAATLLGMELCEPCATLGKRLATETVDAASVVRTFAHQGGLRARIVTGGRIQSGDAVHI